jgi:acetoin utilization protein AcuB
MLALTYLSFEFPVLKLQDSIQKALKLFHSHEISNLAVVDGKRYVGNVTQEILATSIHPAGKLSELTSFFKDYSLEAEEDVFASLPLFEKSQFQLLPVVNEAKEWQGYISLKTLGEIFVTNGFNGPDGGIIYIPFHIQHDSFSLIARIIEENRGLITRSVMLRNSNDALGLPELLIQVQTEQFSAIIQGLERHGVIINKAYLFGKREAADNVRFDLLMKFLNP